MVMLTDPLDMTIAVDWDVKPHTVAANDINNNCYYQQMILTNRYFPQKIITVSKYVVCCCRRVIRTLKFVV